MLSLRLRESLLFTILWLGFRECRGSTPGGSIGTPVRGFDRSWAASCAQGTAVVLRYQDFVLIFLRGPSSNLWRPSIPPASEEISGLRVSPVQSDTVQFAPSWLSLGPNSLCVMTGLGSDVEHLARVLQKQVDSHWNIYDQYMTTHSMTMGMAETFREAAFGSRVRPYGVQCLLVGGDDSDKERIFGVYSIDPSGAWQSWGGATAIGKHAASVREELAKKRSSTPPSNLREALVQICECWMETCKAQNVNLHANEDYQVLVLSKRNGEERCKVYAVDKDDVQSIVDETISAAQTTK